jgi:uncharacterized phage protein gp47/JayE
MTTIPTISQLYTQIVADLETAMDGQTIPIFGKTFLRAAAGVHAAKLKLFYLGLAFLQKNLFIDSADPESKGGTLERFGRIKLGRNPFPARAGQYTVTVTGTVGAIIPESTTFKSNDDSLNPGKLFVLDVAYTLLSTSDSITIRALEAGLNSKLLIGDQLTATAPIALVDKTATVTVETVEPLSEEDIEDYRTKGLDAYRLEPQGGAASDYRLWASDAQGVKQSYAFAKSGYPNEINLFVEATIADSTDGKGSPSAGLLEDVEDVVEFDPDTTKPLEERGRRPLTVLQVHYLPVTPKNIDIEINGFVGINATIQAAIFNALKAAINEIRPFVAAADVLENKNDILDINKIISVILIARPGSTFGTVVLKVDSSSVPTFTFTNGNIPFLNTVTYP